MRCKLCGRDPTHEDYCPLRPEEDEVLCAEGCKKCARDRAEVTEVTLHCSKCDASTDELVDMTSTEIPGGARITLTAPERGWTCRKCGGPVSVTPVSVTLLV